MQMSKKTEGRNKSDATETTAAALATLAISISELVTNGSLDSRFAAKLVKRLQKEAEAVSDDGNTPKLAQRELQKSFDAVDAAIRGHNAKLLVAANASLRTADEGRKAAK
jgi:hypothetical protein